MNKYVKILLKALLEHGYQYLARDPAYNELYAYKTMPHLDSSEELYVSNDSEGNEPYHCVGLSAPGIRMFVFDHDLYDLFGIPAEQLYITVDAKEQPIKISDLLN